MVWEYSLALETVRSPLGHPKRGSSHPLNSRAMLENQLHFFLLRVPTPPQACSPTSAHCLDCSVMVTLYLRARHRKGTQYALVPSVFQNLPCGESSHA